MTDTTQNTQTAKPQESDSSLDKIVIKRRVDMNKQFDKYDYVIKHLQPIKQYLIDKYLKQHNQYQLNILRSKVNCYKKYGADPLQYYQCYDKVQKMLRTNFQKLYYQSDIINKKLDNCLTNCSIKSKRNQDYQICTQGQDGCFSKYKNKVDKLYTSMYKVILADPK